MTGASYSMVAMVKLPPLIGPYGNLTTGVLRGEQVLKLRTAISRVLGISLIKFPREIRRGPLGGERATLEERALLSGTAQTTAREIAAIRAQSKATVSTTLASNFLNWPP